MQHTQKRKNLESLEQYFNLVGYENYQIFIFIEQQATTRLLQIFFQFQLNNESSKGLLLRYESNLASILSPDHK